MQKLIMITLILITFQFSTMPVSVAAQPAPPEKIIDLNDEAHQLAEDLGVDELSAFWNGVVEEYGGYLPENQKVDVYSLLRGETSINLWEWCKALFRYFFHEVIANGQLLGMLLLLTVFSTLLKAIQSSFEQNTVSKVAYTIVFFVLLILALNSFTTAITYVTDTIGRMTDFITALLPLLLSLLAATGGITSATFFHPLMIFLMNTTGIFIGWIVLPLFFLSTVLSIVSNMSENYKATQLAGMLKNAAIWMLGVFATIFLSVLGIQGGITAVADGLGIRTTKFVTSNFIPVVGRMLTDATETIVGAGVLLKNAVGLFGLVTIAVFVAFPAIKIFTVSIVYKLTASLIQPIGDGPIIGTLGLLSKNFLYIFACLVIVSVMFFLCITLIVVTGNITVMIR
ncbi:MAG: stage III sporulation protein AE [Bacilli bacterium]